MNKKGFTLMELIISIGLISIVIMFLFNLLSDVKSSENNNDFNRVNQQTRAIILKTIQEDLTSKKLIGLNPQYNNGTNQVKITFKFAFESGKTTNEKDLIIDTDYIIYDDKVNNIKEKWNIEKQGTVTYINKSCLGYTYNDEFSDNYFSFKINIPIVVNEQSANVIDDIEIFYIGLKKDLIEPIPKNIYNYTVGYDIDTCNK